MTYKNIKLSLPAHTYDKFIRCIYAVANHTTADSRIDTQDAIYACVKAVYCCGGMTDKQFIAIVDVLRKMAMDMDESELQELLNIAIESQEDIDPLYY